LEQLNDEGMSKSEDRKKQNVKAPRSASSVLSFRNSSFGLLSSLVFGNSSFAKNRAGNVTLSS